MKWKARWYKLYAKLTGGEAVWVKGHHRIYLCIARAKFDPFQDGEPVWQIRVDGDIFSLHVKGTLMENHYAKWKYVDESKHVQHTLTYK